MKIVRVSFVGLLLMLSATLPARAQQASASAKTPLVIAAENRTAQMEAAQGKRRIDATVHAGDVLRYRLTFTNTQPRPVRHVALQNPLAAGLQFVPGSVKASRADAQVEYSVDSGKTWSVRPMETVMVDGKSVERAVAPERYTGVRWIVSGWVTPGAAVTAEFEARLASRVAAASPAAPAPAQR